MLYRAIFICCLCVLFTWPAFAQDAPDPSPATSDLTIDEPTITPIRYGQVVEDTITDRAFFDWWELPMNAGELAVIEMQAFDGLSPLIGILNPAGDAVARSDTTRPPEPDSLSVVQYRAEADGVYRIVATREDNANGTTTGSYALRVILAEEAPRRENDLLEVEFRCDEMLITTALVISFNEDVFLPEGDEPQVIEEYIITVYGLDGFQPIIRAEADVSDERLDCTGNADNVPGNQFALPDGTTITISDDDPLDAYAQLALRNTRGQNTPVEDVRVFGNITFTIGSRDGQAGRYFIVLEGLELHDNMDVDDVRVRLGPLARQTDLLAYMVAHADTRLDAFMQVYDQTGAEIAACDDAGRFDCDAVPVILNAGTTITDPTGTRTYLGGRTDAGVRIHRGTTDITRLELGSRLRRTDGPYTLFFMGELPATTPQTP